MTLCARKAGDGWRLCEGAPPPAPRGAQVLVRMLYAPINPADLLAIDGAYSVIIEDGAALGAEGVGVVAAAGPEARDLAVGDLVLPLTRGCWRRLRLLERREVVAVPGGVDPQQAAMLRINPMTALLMLERLALAPGDWLIQNAAGASVAGWVRWFAGARGIHVIDVARRSGDGVIEDGPDLPGRAAALARGAPIRAALDCVAGAATGRMAACLAPDGRVLVYGHLSGAPCSVASQLLTGKGLTLAGFSLRPAEQALAPAARAAAFARVFAAAPANPQRLRVVAPLSRLAEALALARTPGAGRVLLDLGA